MRYIIMTIATAVLMVFAVSVSAKAQDQPSLLEKLDQLEGKLDRIQGVEQEEVSTEDLSDQTNVDEEEVEKEPEETATSGELVSGTGLTGGSNQLGSIVEVESMPLEISGFGDVFLASYQDSELGQDFEIGQVEIDIETNIAEKTVISAAIAYDAESETFGLGAFTVDFHLFDSEAGHFRPIEGIDHSGIIVGQFDVPFGIDWHVYPSIDRKLVSAPLVVENTHDGWNDYGVQLYVENRWFNAVVFGSNGFSYETGEVDALGEPVMADIAFAAGGRFGFTANEYVEIGGSYSGLFNRKSETDIRLIGGDVQLNYENFSAKGEYIEFETAVASDVSDKSSGYYGQGMYNSGNIFLVARYGNFSVDEDGVEDVDRISIGGGWAVLDNCEVRVEHQINSGESDDLTFLQLVVGF